MLPPKRAIEQFREIWKDEFGYEISLDVARANAERLLSLFKFAVSDPPLSLQKDKSPP